MLGGLNIIPILQNIWTQVYHSGWTHGAHFLRSGNSNHICHLPYTLVANRRTVDTNIISEISMFFDGGLNRSPQHFILEGKDGVWDGTEIS